MRERERSAARGARAGRAQARRRPRRAPIARVIALQRSAGNRAVAAVLARHARTTRPRAGRRRGDGHGAGAHAGRAGGRGARDAGRSCAGVHQLMLASPDTRTRNTGLMLDPPGERARRPAGARAADDAALGLGPARRRPRRQRRARPRTTSTARTRTTSTATARARWARSRAGARCWCAAGVPAGAWQTERGRHGRARPRDAATSSSRTTASTRATATDAGSFDRYRDEFRAYFVEPHGNFDGLTGAAAGPRRSRTTSSARAPTTGGYPDLRTAYWARPRPRTRSASRSTRTRRPTASTSTTARCSTASSRCCAKRPAGRRRGHDLPDRRALARRAAEAAGASLIASLAAPRSRRRTRQRVRQALTSPAAVGFGRELNPNQSPQRHRVPRGGHGPRAGPDRRGLPAVPGGGARRASP